MKLYVLRERRGKYVISPRAPEQEAIPSEPIEKAGVGFDMIHWGDWALKTFAEKVIIYNFLAKYAVDHLGFYGPKAVTWINWSIARGIAYEARWALWRFAGLLGVYAGIAMIAVYYSPAQSDFIWAEVAPERYLMRYQERIWMADLWRIDRAGTPHYHRFGMIGDCIIGEDLNVRFPLGFADRWDTGFVWQQRRSRFIHHESWSWSDVFVQYIGLLENLGREYYSLRTGFTDPWIAELPPGFINPYVGREWDPDYRMP